MTPFLASAAGIISALFIAYSVATSDMSFEHYRRLSRRTRITLAAWAFVAGSGLLSCLYLIFRESQGRTLAGAAATIVVTLTLVLVGALVGILPFLRLLIRGAVLASELTEANQRLREVNEEMLAVSRDTAVLAKRLHEAEESGLDPAEVVTEEEVHALRARAKAVDARARQAGL